MSSTVGMPIENRADMNTLNAVGNEWVRNNENGIAVSKEKLEVLQKSFNLAKSTIKKNRTVSILTHNMKDKAVWANFKQVFKNIGRNIGVLARTIATFGENKTIALEAEQELAENLGTMKKMMNCLDEGNFKDFFKFLCEKDCADYLSDLRNCEKELKKLGIEDKDLIQKCKDHLDAIRTKSNEMRNFIIEHTDIEPLKQLFKETEELLTNGTKETYEQALHNLDKIKEHENFIKGYNALVTDANKDCSLNEAKPLLYGNRSEYHKIIEDIEKVRNTGFLKDLHAPNYFYSSPKYEDPIRDALLQFGSNAYEDRRKLLDAHSRMENDCMKIYTFQATKDPEVISDYEKCQQSINRVRTLLNEVSMRRIYDTASYEKNFSDIEKESEKYLEKKDPATGKIIELMKSEFDDTETAVSS